MNFNFLTVLNFLQSYHDSIVAFSVIGGGGWWWLNQLNGLITRKISGENSLLFQHLDQNKKDILNQIKHLENYTKAQDRLILEKIDSTKEILEKEIATVNNRVDRIENRYDLIIDRIVPNKDEF
jgi:hypothetical protein